ncbi:ADP-specific phosphofructokinase/glucokinase like protein [Aduncisulcus paluster]|uniref:ADP-specific phosphofructokinase/glucokinase like protein n=1 Tax=Aduncisulcus paluster TaxID=2918883 RepID=A0ABQ5K3G0_9EUKA|nr:ADP-specific phosphofructokinase/glucokinase like protein [Aduncisulcus paluster]
MLATAEKVKVFAGYNVNIDAKLFIRSAEDYEMVMDLLMKESEELARTFENYVEKSSACEKLVSSKLVDDMLASFEDPEYVLGGQEGFFFQNLVNTFSKQVVPVLHLPSRAPFFLEFMKKIMPEALVFEKNEASEPILLALSSVEPNPAQSAPIHIVAEYPTGLTVKSRFGEGEITTSRANRFIFTYDPINSSLILDEFFTSGYKTLIDKTWMVLLSGYHLLTGDILTDEFKDKHTTIMKDLAAQSGWVHFELAFTSDDVVREFILKSILPFAQSVGLNEVELVMFAKATMGDSSEFDSMPFPTLMAKWHHAMGLNSTILFHTIGCYMSLAPKDVKVAFKPQHVMDGFKKAENVLISTRKPADGKFEIAHKTFEFNEKTLDDFIKKGCSEREYESVMYHVGMMSRISSTVGLGDTISSSIVVQLVLASLEKEDL